MKLKKRNFAAEELVVIAQSEEFQDIREPPLRLGDRVRLNSGGPESLVVDVGEQVTIAWQDGSATREYRLPRACLHRVR
jgi:uncharacterized protein YodC (DUF2158 family)